MDPSLVPSPDPVWLCPNVLTRCQHLFCKIWLGGHKYNSSDNHPIWGTNVDQVFNLFTTFSQIIFSVLAFGFFDIKGISLEFYFSGMSFYDFPHVLDCMVVKDSSKSISRASVRSGALWVLKKKTQWSLLFNISTWNLLAQLMLWLKTKPEAL